MGAVGLALYELSGELELLHVLHHADHFTDRLHVAILDGSLNDARSGDGLSGGIGAEEAPAFGVNAVGVSGLDHAHLANSAGKAAHHAIARYGDLSVVRREAEWVALGVEDRVALLVGERAVRHGAEMTGAREAGAARRADGKEAVASEGEIEGVAGVAQRARLLVAIGGAVLREGEGATAFWSRGAGLLA